MGTREEEELEDLQSTMYTFPADVQSVIEQVGSSHTECYEY